MKKQPSEVAHNSRYFFSVLAWLPKRPFYSIAGEIFTDLPKISIQPCSVWCNAQLWEKEWC